MDKANLFIEVTAINEVEPINMIEMLSEEYLYLIGGGDAAVNMA